MNNNILDVRAFDGEKEEVIQFSVEPYIFIVLMLILICLLYLMNFNVFGLVFDFTKQFDNIFRDVTGFVLPIFNNLHLDRMAEQALEIF
jgi:hypothetical protein